MKNVIVVVGSGQIGQAIARRVGVGKHILLADLRQENANAAAEVLGNAGYDVSVVTVDVSSRKAVDALVEKAVAAQTQGSLDNTCRALDRVLRSGRYWIPHWNKASHWVAYWDQFGFPPAKPRYARGAPDTWWFDQAKAAKLDQAK